MSIVRGGMCASYIQYIFKWHNQSLLCTKPLFVTIKLLIGVNSTATADEEVTVYVYVLSLNEHQNKQHKYSI